MTKIDLSWHLTLTLWFFGIKPHDTALGQHFCWDRLLNPTPANKKFLETVRKKILLWGCSLWSSERNYISTWIWHVWAHANAKYLYRPKTGLGFVPRLEESHSSVTKPEKRSCSSRRGTQGGDHWSMKEQGRALEAGLGKAVTWGCRPTPWYPHCPAGDALMESAPFVSKTKSEKHHHSWITLGFKWWGHNPELHPWLSSWAPLVSLIRLGSSYKHPAYLTGHVHKNMWKYSPRAVRDPATKQESIRERADTATPEILNTNLT